MSEPHTIAKMVVKESEWRDSDYSHFVREMPVGSGKRERTSLCGIVNDHWKPDSRKPKCPICESLAKV
jgi:hypothetical protein